MILRCALIALFSLSQFQHSYANESYTLQRYREQVQSQDPAYEGTVLQLNGVKGAALAADALSDTQFFIKVMDLNDERPTQNPNFQGTRTTGNLISVGIKKQSEWGPQFSLSHNYSHTKIYDADSVAIPLPEYYDVFPEIQVVIPFWRNFLGSETRSEVESSKALNETRKMQSDIQYIQMNAKIDLAFYALAASQERLQIQKDIYDRALKILTWVKDQHKRSLIDISDVYQAQAAVDLRKIELVQAEDELRNQARHFNDLRGRDGDSIAEQLVVPELMLSELKLNKDKIRQRKDLKIEIEQMLMQKLEFQSGLEKAKPQLDLTMKAQWIGRDLKSGEARSEWEKGDQPYYYVGLEFSAPLNIPKYMKVRSGLRQMRRGEELKLESQKKTMEVSWYDFVSLGQKLQEHVQLFRSLENTQKLKSDAERKRFQRGRSTTFQVLMFEQDFISARSQRIAAELQARQFVTQIPLFD